MEGVDDEHGHGPSGADPVQHRAVKDGYDVVVGARDLAAAEVLASEIGATALRVDLQDESTIAAAAQRLKDGTDHIVTTGSAPHDVHASELDRDRLLAAFTAKVVGPLLVAKHFAPVLRPTGLEQRSNPDRHRVAERRNQHDRILQPQRLRP